MTTIKDVAREAGVSLGTVSNVLNGRESVKPENREKVLKAIKKLRFHYNMTASALRTKTTKNIGLIIPTIINPYYPELARGVEDEARKAGFTVFLCNSDRQKEKEKVYINALLSKGVDGIILIKPQMERSELLELGQQTALVIQDCEVNEDDGLLEVNVNDYVGIVQGMNLLFRYGHSRIAFLGGLMESHSSRRRMKAYEDCLESRKIQYRQDYVSLGDYSTNSGFNMMKKLLKTSPLPTAVIASNDMMAMGAMKAIQEKGLQIPADISVIGYDDIEMGKLCTPALTTIHQPKYEVGVAAFRLLKQTILGEDIPPEQKHIVMETRMVQRESVGYAAE